MQLFMFLLLALPIAAIGLPRRYLSFVGASVVCVYGIAWLSDRVVPFYDKPWAFFGELVLLVWISLIGLTIAARLVFAKRWGVQPDKIDPVSRVAWQIPAGLLISDFFMHWLRNRLAGVEPATLVHFILLLAALVPALIIAGWIWRRPVLRLDGRPFGLVLFLTALAIVISNVFSAREFLSLARNEAAGRPFCALSFAGNLKQRPAHHVLDLSPIVSRYGGTDAASRAFWLVIQTDSGPRAFELKWRHERPYFSPATGNGMPGSDAAARRLAACTPIPDGGIRDL